MSQKKEVATQFGTAYGADFEEKTWTFLMPDNFKVWAGEFAIVDKSVYERMLSVLKTIDDCHDVYSPDLGMTNRIFEDVSKAIAAAEGQVV